MNFRIIAKTLGVLSLLIAVSMGICALYAVYEAGQPEARAVDASATKALGLATLFSTVFGVVLYLIGRKTPNDILRREAMVMVGVAWFLVSGLGAIPYILCEPGLPVIGSFFESVSGFTTTGSSVMTDIESFPKAILLWRSVSQWLGGIGILVVFVAILSFLGVGCRSLVKQESSLNISDAGVSRIREVTWILLKVYVSLTLLCSVGLFLIGMPVFEAVCHGLTTMATGGFSPKNASLAHYDSVWIEAWIGLFMFLGSVSFMIYVFLIKRRWERLKAEEEAKYYFLMLLLFFVIILVDLVVVKKGMTAGHAAREAFFNVLSVSSTTGFGASDYDQWPHSSRMMLLILMAVGGCAGSTAGGIKMNRVILFAKIAMRELARSFRPNLVHRIKLNGVSPDEQVFVTTSFFIALAGVVAGVAVLLVSLLQPALDFESSVGSVFATLFNVGPGLGAVGPTDNFAFFNPATLLLLSFLMVLGRLEFIAVLVLLVPSLWRKY